MTRSGGAPHGGPRVPVRALKVVERVPPAVVDTMWLYEEAVHPTEIAVLTGVPRATVGSFEASLHSRSVPGELAASPDPVTDTP